MLGPETGQNSDVVDLTLSERFGYNRKTSFNNNADSCQAKTESCDFSAMKRHFGRSWEEDEWHKRPVDEQKSLMVDLTDVDGIHVIFSTLSHLFEPFFVMKCSQADKSA